MHVGVDISYFVFGMWFVLFEGLPPSKPFALLEDGDLLLVVQGLLEKSGRGLTRVTKVKGHADEEMVRSSPVRDLDREGNDKADEAADFGRRKVPERVIDARLHLSVL